MDSLSFFCLLPYAVLLIALLSQAVGRRAGERSPDEDRPQPRFLDTPLNFTYKSGELARLECSLESLGTKKVIWRKSSDPNPLTIGKKRYVDDIRIMVEHMPLGQDWHLLIKQVRLDDEGQYECQVSSKDKKLRKYVNLIVKPGDKRGTPEIHIEGATYVEKNSVIRLACNATGEEHPPDDIDWFVNGQKLATDYANQISIQKRVSLTEKTIYSILEIRNANMKDAGIYVCRTSDLQIASERVDVLNADTNNVKRGGVDLDGNKYDRTREGYYDSHATSGRGRLPGGGSRSSSSGSMLAVVSGLLLTALCGFFQFGTQHRPFCFVT